MALSLTSVVLTFAVLEAVMRVIVAPPTHPRIAEHDGELGWRPRGGVSFDGVASDSAGTQYRYHYSTDEHGFRARGGASATARPRVLFVGDSFTHAVHVDDDAIYPRLLHRQLDFELFVHAQTGYGTVQQMLALERWIGAVQPDLVVLQVCDNDFIDNHVELEREAQYNLGLRRPYMTVSGEVKPALPAGPIANVVARSRIGAWMVHRTHHLRSSKSIEARAETRIAMEGAGYGRYQDALVIFSRALGRFRDAAARESAPVIGFAATGYQPQLEHFKSVFSYHEVPFAEHAVIALEAARRDGVAVTTADRVHWSPAGHRIVAEALMPFVGEHLSEAR